MLLLLANALVLQLIHQTHIGQAIGDIFKREREEYKQQSSFHFLVVYFRAVCECAFNHDRYVVFYVLYVPFGLCCVVSFDANLLHVGPKKLPTSKANKKSYIGILAYVHSTTHTRIMISADR